MIELSNVTYDYTSKAGKVHALRGVSVKFEPGKMYAITGRSGSGKTTLLSLIAGLDSPLNGTITVNGTDISGVDRDKYRRENIGMVFQAYYLLPQLTVAENIMLSSEITKQAKPDVGMLLEIVGLSAFHGKKRANQLSGGEQQRVAIARAIATEPPIILADEPTGNLDTENGKNIIDILKTLAREQGYCVIVVTHDLGIAAEADEVLHLSDGMVKAE